MVHVVPLGDALGNGAHGMQQGYSHQCCQKEQEHRIQEFTDVHDKLAGLQAEQQCRPHK